MNEMWERRVRRAEELQKLWPFGGESLRFFRAVTGFQMDVCHRVRKLTTQDPRHLNTGLFVPFVPPFLDLVMSHGPRELIPLAERLKDRQEAEWEGLFRAYWNGRGGAGGERTIHFFARAILQPFMMSQAARWRDEVGAFAEDTDQCPFCGRPAVMSVLRPVPGREESARSLLCSLCGTEWAYPRIQCPGCHEDRSEKLPRYTAREIAWMRIEGCDTCRHYLKAVELRRCPEAEPVVDEVGSTPLNALADQHGYSKLELNIVGV